MAIRNLQKRLWSKNAEMATNDKKQFTSHYHIVSKANARAHSDCLYYTIALPNKV